MKKLLLMSLCGLICSTELAAKEPPLTDPILKDIDGLPGIFDKTKVKNTIWGMRQIRSVHQGFIKLNENNEPDPRHGKVVQLTFKGEPQTLETLIAWEKNTTLSPEDKAELTRVFLRFKSYFGAVNVILSEDARGAEEFMIKLIKEYCRKNNRPNSQLLKWDKNVSEAEMYKRNINSFAIFKEFSIDLLNFLGALIESCPKAFASFKATYMKK